MTRKIFLVLTFCLLSLNYVFAQEQKTVVRTNEAAAFNIQNARLNNFAVKNKKNFEEKFLLSFQIPNFLESVLPQTKVVLTAYNEKGGIFGQHIWALADSGAISKLSADNLQVIFDVNPKLRGASDYSLSMFSGDQADPTTCPACVGLANDACGRGSVGSVTCGADGSCAFTCK